MRKVVAIAAAVLLALVCAGLAGAMAEKGIIARQSMQLVNTKPTHGRQEPGGIFQVLWRILEYFWQTAIEFFSNLWAWVVSHKKSRYAIVLFQTKDVSKWPWQGHGQLMIPPCRSIRVASSPCGLPLIRCVDLANRLEPFKPRLLGMADLVYAAAMPPNFHRRTSSTSV